MSCPLQYPPGYKKSNPSLDFFFRKSNPIPAVLEIGTKQWVEGVSTHHKALFPNAYRYVMTDVSPGKDVDQFSDIHRLDEYFDFQSFDIIWCSSVFEHLYNPWIAAQEMMKVLKPGGVFFIQTHLIFPEHGYPSDYFRFTTEGLKSLFAPYCSEMVACYDFPCEIIPADKTLSWNTAAPAFLNACISGVKA